MLLPRTNKDGKPRISYSQVTSWRALTGFNEVEVEGRLKKIAGTSAYILQYFFGYPFPPSPMDIYAPFGQKVEDAICEQNFNGFDQEETRILKTIQPIGVFQKEVEIDFGDFCLLGYIDDTDEDQLYLRDYKTASKSSKSKYYGNDYLQLDVYALDKLFKEDTPPEKMEVCIILRGGSHLKPPLTVKGVEYVDRKISIVNMKMAEAIVRDTVREISESYELFLEIKEKTK